MKSLRRELFVPTVVLTLVIGAAVGYLTWESVLQARALERHASQVRAATALALALVDAAHDEEHWLASLPFRPEAVHGPRIAEAAERVARLSAEIDALPLQPRAADVWRQFVESRGTLRAVGDEVVAAARRGDSAALSLALEKRHLVSARTDALLRNFTAFHLNLLDRTIVDLQGRRVRSLVSAGVAVVLGLLLASAFSVLIARTVVRPIVDMANAARRISATGALSPVAGAERNDEIGMLARAFNDMTDRLVGANQSLARSNEDLAEAVRAREEFISIASHELKTPITPLALRVQQLLRIAREGEDGALAREHAVHVTRSLERQVVKLNKLVENLLNVSRITAGHLALRTEDVALLEVLRDAVERASEELAAAECDARIECPRDVVVRADRSRLDQVIDNLLANAAKYAPGGPVVVRAVVEQHHVDVEVSDAGPGIPQQDQERIFARFERASPHQHVSGLGLGLFIAREIARAHGGDLWVRSEAGGGTTFTLRLRRHPQQA